MSVGDVVEILKLSASPPNIIYPIPLLPILVFVESSKGDLFKLGLLILFSSIFYAGINLWNHVNDVEEDILAGRRTVLTENPKIRFCIAVASITMYVISAIIVLSNLVDYRGVVFFLVVVALTWMYSDRIIFGRIVRRLKDHYVTELMAFSASIPSFTLTLWCMVDEISPKAVIISIAITFFMLVGIFPKDLKDATGDELAGLKTLAAVFRPSTLIKLSFLMAWLYYATIVLGSFTYLPRTSLLATIPMSVLIYTTYRMWKNGWSVNVYTVNYIRVTAYSNIVSLILLIISAPLSRSLPTFPLGL